MILVLNFGGQFAHLIARRVRDLGVHSEILPGDTPVFKILALKPQGIILSGSPASVLAKGSVRPPKEIFALDIPILGICYGEQLMAAMLGGKVRKGNGNKEFGKETIRLASRAGIFAGLSPSETVWFSHGDSVAALPKHFVRLASTTNCPIAAMAHKTKPFYGVQFHVEVTHTVHGRQILSNFIFKICRAKKDWVMKDLPARLIAELRQKIGDSHAIIGISGGVDSLVAATLLHKAIGSRLHAVFVDTGLLRKDEVRQVSEALRKRKFRDFRVIDARRMFLRKLRGVTDPEKKRQIIGHTFISVFETAMRTTLKRYPIHFFAQGTIYPDRIESAEPSKHASKIKSHHNLTLPAKLGFTIVEPLRELYKDEVRAIGGLLGLSHDLVWRHPFPGPGLAIRVVGEITEERLRILRDADAIFTSELRKSGEYDRIWQAFAVLLPLKTVGVMGDERTYEYMIALRAVDSIDGMTADWHKIPQALLERISSRIVNETRGVNRVLYDITQKPPATIEYE